jgi:DnaJ-class molecular chaperone
MQLKECPTCLGTGYITVMLGGWGDDRTCEHCDGSGQVPANPNQKCQGKVRHGTREKALAEVRRLAARDGDVGLVAYSCQNCQGWHVGHPKPWEVDPGAPEPRPAYRTRNNIW